MRVKILTEICGEPTFHRGDVVDLPARIALAWIKEGDAVAVTGEPTEEPEVTK